MSNTVILDVPYNSIGKTNNKIKEIYDKFISGKFILKARLIKLSRSGVPVNPNWKYENKSDSYEDGYFYGLVPLSKDRFIIDFLGKDGIEDYKNFVKDYFLDDPGKWNYHKRYNIVKCDSKKEEIGGTVIFKLEQGFMDRINEKQSKYPHLRFLHAGNGFVPICDQTIQGVQYCFVTFRDENLSINGTKLEVTKVITDNLFKSNEKGIGTYYDVECDDFGEVLKFIKFNRVTETKVIFALLDNQLSVSDARKFYLQWVSLKNKDYAYSTHSDYFNAISRNNDNLPFRNYNIGFRALLSWALKDSPTSPVVHEIRRKYKSIEDVDLKMCAEYCRYYAKDTTSKTTLYDSMYYQDDGVSVNSKALRIVVGKIDSQLRKVYNRGMGKTNVIISLASVGFIRNFADYKYDSLNPRLIIPDDQGNLFLNVNTRS